VRYLVIDTRNWWLDKKVLVAPQWTTRIDWLAKNLYVDLTREMIKSSPAWNPSAAINREYEGRLYDYYGRPAYWASGNTPGSTQGPAHLPTAHI
jgi:hypothetical protein